MVNQNLSVIGRVISEIKSLQFFVNKAQVKFALSVPHVNLREIRIKIVQVNFTSHEFHVKFIYDFYTKRQVKIT